MKIFLLRCPKCKNTMKYGSKDCILIGKRKQCVYCGFSMSVRKAIAKSLPTPSIGSKITKAVLEDFSGVIGASMLYKVYN